MRTIFALLSKLVNIYSTLVWIRIILSWIPKRSNYNSYGQYTQNNESVIDVIRNLLAKIVDPFLNFFRGKKLRVGMVDFSPLLGFMVLNFVRSVFSILAQSGRISLGLVLVLIIQNLWSYLFSYILLAIVIMLVVRLIASSNPNSGVIRFLDPILNGPVCLVWKIFYGKKQPSEKQLIVTSLIFYLVIYIAVKNGLSYLVSYLALL